jgi:hypothetical protein
MNSDTSNIIEYKSISFDIRKKIIGLKKVSFLKI